MASQSPAFHAVKIWVSHLCDLFIGVRQTSTAIVWYTLSIMILILAPIGVFKTVEDRAMVRLILLFLWRYYRFFFLLFFFWRYTAAKPLTSRTVYPKDATIIIPTVSVSENTFFEECLTKCLINQPGAVEVVTATKDDATKVNTLLSEINEKIRTGKSEFTSGVVDISEIDVRVNYTGIPNKRVQIAFALPNVRTRLVVLIDDHEFLKPRFLVAALLPFEDKDVGLCGTKKVVRRITTTSYWKSVWNVLGALYLTRHNFEIRATNAQDGGAFVISSRAAIILAEIVQDPKFIEQFTNERFFFRKFGPLNPDDDNFITRWVVKHSKRYEVKFQDTEDATIETALGEYPKFLGQCLRWARTTYRSNLCSLITDRTIWRRWPQTVLTTYVPSLINLALFWDFGIIYSFVQTRFYTESKKPIFLLCLIFGIFSTKLVKLVGYFRQHPLDFVLFFPAYLIFIYFHSLLKLYAFFTFWDHSWTGRNLFANP